MKNIVLLSCSFFLFISFQSCMSEKSKENKEQEEFVEFYNFLLRRDSDFDTYVEHLNIALTAIVEHNELFKVDPNSKDLNASLRRYPHTPYYDSMKIPKFLREKYEDLVNDYLLTFKPLQELSEKVKEYEKKKKWSYDNAQEEYQALVGLGENLISAYHEKRDPLFEKLFAEMDEKEDAFLEDHPYKDQIERATTILDLMDDTISAVSEAIDDDDALVEILKEYTTKVQEAYDIEAPFKSGIPYGEKGNYYRFNEQVEQFIAVGREISQHIEEGKDDINSELEQFSSSYEKAYSHYNNWASL